MVPRLTAAARANWLFLAFALVGAGLRVLTSLAYRPAIELVQDSFSYLADAQHLAPNLIRPVGYSIFLRLLSPTGRLGVVTLVQHLLGLGIGVVIYVLLRRFGAGPWLAALGAAPALLDGYQIYVEHFIMAETLFQALVVAALALLLWRRRPSALECAVAGALLGASAVTRTVGVLLLVPALGYLIVTRVGWARVAATGGAAAMVLVSYAGWFDATHGRFALSAFDGYFLAGRVQPFADCRGLTLTAQEQALCDPRPAAQRNGPDWYDWNPDAPIRRIQLPPATDRNALAGGFARKVIRHQPLDYLRAIAGDVVHYFAPGRSTGPKDNPVQAVQFRTSYTPVPWQPEYPPADPYVQNWTWPGSNVAYGIIPATHGFDLKPVSPKLDAPLARRLRSYQRFGYTPGPVLALALVVAVAATVGRLRPAHRRLRWASLLLASSGLLVLVAPAASAAFDYRYLLPALTMLPPAGVLGVVACQTRVRQVPASSGADRTAAPAPERRVASTAATTGARP